MVTAVVLSALLAAGVAGGDFLWTHGHPGTVLLVVLAAVTVNAVAFSRE